MEDEILDMEQEGEVVTPRDVEDAEDAQGREPAGEQRTETAEPSGQRTQSHEDNRRYQAARRSGEQAGYDRAMREVNDRIARSGMRSPATGETIRDIEGLESYGKAFRQQHIKERAAKEGRSEAEVEEEEANREFVTASRRQAEEERRRKDDEARQLAWARQDADAFAQAFPDVDLSELTGNKAFLRFCGSRFGREPLAGLYEDYREIAGEARQSAEARQESKKGRATGTGGTTHSEALSAAEQRSLDEWNERNPDMKMTAKDLLKWRQ